MTALQRNSLTLLAWIGFLALYAWFYQQALWTYFSQDDFPLLITSKPGAVPLLNFFRAGGPEAYRPLTQHFYFHFNQLLFGLDPVGHHLANLTVHLLNALLVGWLASRWIAGWTFLPAAFVYAFHPVHFFEIYWISAITQSGYLFFLLCTLAGFALYRLRTRTVFLFAACLAAVCAFFSKEDSVALPAIVSLSALLPLAGERLNRKRLAASLIPFWLLLAAFWVFRAGVIGLGLPGKGVYIFSFELARTGEKLWMYGLWLFKGKALGFPLALGALLIGVIALLRRRGDRQEQSNSATQTAILAAMAGASIAPSFFIFSSVDYYLSFSVAALACIIALLLDRIPPAWPRMAVTAMLLISLLQMGQAGRDFNLSSESLWTPVPRKARLCRKWVEQLRSQPAPPFECGLLFRDVPLASAWEKAWFIYLPMVAWDRIYSRIAAHTPQNPEPERPEGPCVRVWSFASGEAVLIEASGGR